jgi:hypothetical protein
MKANEGTCPKCGKVGALDISMKLVANPIGSFSLSGYQMKASTRLAPFLECLNCDFAIQGKIDTDGKHAIFTNMDQG